jgi:hypothetical protein
MFILKLENITHIIFFQAKHYRNNGDQMEGGNWGIKQDCFLHGKCTLFKLPTGTVLQKDSKDQRQRPRLQLQKMHFSALITLGLVALAHAMPAAEPELELDARDGATITLDARSTPCNPGSVYCGWYLIDNFGKFALGVLSSSLS